MKVLIIGGVAGGATTAARLRRLNEDAEIIIFEKDADISFANCGIPYFVGEVITNRTNMTLMNPKKFKEIYKIDARVYSEVTAINRDSKTVAVLNKQTNEKYEESYDILVLSPGASPIVPKIENINSNKIFTVRNLQDADGIKDFITNHKVKTATVIGGGFIGIEMAENLAHLGLSVSLVEAGSQVLNFVDSEIALQAENTLQKHGVQLYKNNAVTKFIEKDYFIDVQLQSNESIKSDIVILAIGVKPEIHLAKNAGLEIGELGGIKVNEYLQTNDNNIYALGDAIEVNNAVAQQNALMPLAGPANKQGRVVANNICGIKSRYKSTQGTAIVKVFNKTIAATGLNEKQLQKLNIPYLTTHVQGNSHAGYYPHAKPMNLKLLFNKQGNILGAQAIGEKGVDKRIDTLATVIKLNGTIEDLIELEFSYAPPFGSAKDIVNVAGMSASNMLGEVVHTVSVMQAQELIKQGAVVLDVRDANTFVKGALENAINIPMQTLRSSFNKILKDKPILVYCYKGMFSYLAYRILKQNGFKEVYSMSGGYNLYNDIYN